ncbi:MAG: hypothetical protein JXB38_02150 [Anaerolineales bacterium]|nr:hypothetical protein [Anaerolineales bacterium]
MDQSDDYEIITPMIRISKTKLSGSLLRYMFLQLILSCTDKQKEVIRVSDYCLTEEIKLVLYELGFTPANGHWVKLNIDFIGKVNELITYLKTSKIIPNALQKTLYDTLHSSNLERYSLFDIERRIWPGKIIDSRIPIYTVPIKPRWALELFDENLAGQTFFSTKEEIILLNENVYYRSSRNSRGISSPSRILWYVSDGKGYQKTKHIRACSLLDEVIVEPAKQLFKKFERLGIYEWNNIEGLTGKDPQKPIMAIKFSNTELFPNPISLTEYRRILLEIEGKNPVLQSPQQISSQTFQSIYKIGKNIPARSSK